MPKPTFPAAGGALTAAHLSADLELKRAGGPARRHADGATLAATDGGGPSVTVGAITRRARSSFLAPLSTLIADPFVRRAFERAEREDGTAPAVATAEPRKPLRGGAEARREAVHAKRKIAAASPYLPPRKAPWPEGELSFTRIRRKPGASSPRDFWVVEETGDYGADCETGERLARECLAAMRAGNDPNTFHDCVAAMIAKGRFGGVELGFCFAFACWAMRSSSKGQRDA